MKFNEEKLQRLNAEVQRGYANLRDLGRSSVEIGQEIHRLQVQISSDPATAARYRHDRMMPSLRGRLELSDHAIQRLSDLEQRLEKLERKKARIAAMYDEAALAQTGRARLLESAMRFLREKNIQVDLAIDGSTHGVQWTGPVSDTVQAPFGNFQRGA